MTLTEGAELTGEGGKTYMAVSPLGQANVWTAVEINQQPNSPPHVVVVKEPGADDTGPGWPNFQNEMIMHELLKDSEAIRQQVDRIPPTKPGDPPMLVLEISETTLWGARTKRPFSLAELKHVTKDALVGLRNVHAQGLVYADLKMQNIMVDGFDPSHESNPKQLTASLGDLGIVMEPANGKVQPVSYRAPEVYFKGDITPKADIWGWGLIYCHLLEARKRFDKTGLYDDLNTGNGTMFEREEAVRNAVSNDYKLQNNASYSGVSLPRNDAQKGKGSQWEILRQRGLEDGEVDFLRWVLRADPRKRPSAEQILRSGWLDKTEEEVARGFDPPANGVGRNSLEFDPKRASPDEVTAQKELEENTAKGSYFAQPSRPIMSNKRFHSEEEETAMKRTTAPVSNLASTAENPVPQTSSTSPAQSNPVSSYFSQSSSSFGGKMSSFFSGQPGSSFFAGRPSPYTSNSHPAQPGQSASTASPGQPGQYTSTSPSGQSSQYTSTSPPGQPSRFTSYTSPSQSGQYTSNTPSSQYASTSTPVQTVPYTPPTSSSNSLGIAERPAPTTAQSEQAAPQRPGLSTTNTGTFLSYR